MSSQDFISIAGVHKDFGAFKAVNDVNLDIVQGEFFALLGPSGCGKSTLLRMLAGFEVPSAGRISIDGQDVSLVPPHRRPVNMVFQSYAIFPHLNVRQNLAFGLRTENLSKAEQDSRVEEALELIKLSGFGDRGASEMSGGQRQRVALARALIKRPKVLLLDEPLGALDKKLREQMQIELRQLQKSVGITFVFVTHDQEEALTMADRMAVMAAGEVLEVGSPEELYEHPKSRFVADFVGTMNFFDAEVRAVEQDHYVVTAAGLGTIQAPRNGLDLSVGSRATVAIRPENLVISEEKPTDDRNLIEGSIGANAYLGDRSYLHLRVVDYDAPVLASLQNLKGIASRIGHRKDALWLSWDPKSLIVLPPS